MASQTARISGTMGMSRPRAICSRKRLRIPCLELSTVTNPS